MPKRKKSKKEKNIESNSLLPARHDGEKPDIPFQIKEEPPEDPAVQDLLDLIEKTKKDTMMPEDAEASNHSDISTATEPMETDDGTVSDSLAADQMMPSFDEIRVKQELESEIANEWEPRAPEFLPNNSSSNNEVLNSVVKEKTVQNIEYFQEMNSPQMINTTVNIKKEPTENNDSELKNCNHEALPTKRKLETLEEKLEMLRKRIKTEPIEDSLSVLVKTEEENVNNESLGEMATEETMYDDIAVLPIQKVNKVIDVITVSDEEDQISESQTASPINSPKKMVRERNFSTDILNFFSVVSELDRYDCKTCLDSLTKYKTKDTLQKFFPIVKKEAKSKDKIQKGDILFKRVAVKAFTIERAPIHLNSTSNYPSNKKSPYELKTMSQNVIRPSLPTVVSQCVNLPDNSTSQSSMNLPTFPSAPVSSKSESQNQQPAASALNASAGGVTLLDLQKLLQFFNQNPSLPIHDAHQNALPKSPDYNLNALPEPELQNPQKNVHQNATDHVVHPNLQLQDPRLKKRIHSEKDSAIPVVNTSFIPSQPVAPPSDQDYQRSSITYQARVPGTLPTSNKVTFPRRKGMKDLLLYHNVGRDDITEHIETLILQWNPSWLEIQKTTGSCPPICKSYPTVGYSYRNETDYYNAYVPLHLLHIWCSIYQSWDWKLGIPIKNCKINSVERSGNGFKISCSIELDDSQVWPKRDDIVLCQHKQEEAFLRIENVLKKPTHISQVSKLRIVLESLHDLNLKLDDEINFLILWNIRTACLQTAALRLQENSFKGMVLKPESFSSYIGIVQLDGGRHIKEQRDSVFAILKVDDVRIIVIETYPSFNDALFLTQLTYNIVYNASRYELIPRTESQKKQFKVFILLKNDELLHRLYRSLIAYNPVLAVRTKQIKLAPELIRHTLEDRLERMENLNDILNKHHIFISTFSAFGSVEKAHLSKLKDLICIIDDAHLCTEVETALPLTLKIKRLLLIGFSHQPLELPNVLKNQNYHLSLFVRLLKAGRRL